MKPFTLLFLSFLFFAACNNDDDIDCPPIPATTPIMNSLFIELVDEEGNNLIENDTFNGEEILIRFNGFEIRPVVFDDVPGIENLIIINLIGSEGDNTFEIQLSESEIDTLILNLTLIPATMPCGSSFFTLNTANYNGIDQAIENFMDDSIITVVRPL